MIFTGIYTIIGGLRAVVYTEAFQAIILIVGSSIITWLGLQEVGGWGQLQGNCHCSESDHFDMWRPMSDPDFPGPGC